MVEGGSRPECEQGCVWWFEEVWEPPAGGAGRGQPQREWQVGWGMQRRLWGETDLQGGREIYPKSGQLHVVKCSMKKYMNSFNMLHGGFPHVSCVRNYFPILTAPWVIMSPKDTIDVLKNDKHCMEP